jgi:hypothetical protein
MQSLQSFAVERSCMQETLYRMLGSNDIPEQLDPTTYAKAQSILLLSDGTREVDFNLGDRLRKIYPEKRIVSTDFAISETVHDQSFTQMHIDNTRKLPFEDNSFDQITLSRGVCVCHHGRCCAGFYPESDEAKNFFREVARVLNKKNPYAQAILHGSKNVTFEHQKVWEDYLFSTEREYDVKATLLIGNGLFKMIKIEPRSLMPLPKAAFRALDF